jgi:5-methylthioadenosine/S-adenosylhomocysteine deaminase
MFDPVNHVVFAASRGDVRHVWTDGAWTVRDRRLTRFDMTDTLAEIRDLVPKIERSIAE